MKTINDVHNTLIGALNQIEEIQRRTEEPELEFAQKVIKAGKYVDSVPVGDLLTYDEVRQVIQTLADVYAVTGVKMPEDF